MKVNKPMSEFENQEAALQNFIGEIKKIKETFPSLFAVKDVNDLQREEGQVWEEYKSLFKKILAELSKSDMPKEEVLGQLLEEIRNLTKSVKNIMPSTKNNNRLEFLAWMNNRLGGLYGNLQVLESEPEDKSLLQEIRESFIKEKNDLLF